MLLIKYFSEHVRVKDVSISQILAHFITVTLYKLSHTNVNYTNMYHTLTLLLTVTASHFIRVTFVVIKFPTTL